MAKSKRKRRKGTLFLSYPVDAGVLVRLRGRCKKQGLKKEAVMQGLLVMIEDWPDAALVLAQNVGQSDDYREQTAQVRKEIGKAVGVICASSLRHPPE